MGLTKKAEKTKTKLLDTALRLINERGFDAVSVEDITRESGVAKGTFYHYFHSKGDITFELSYATAEKIARDAIAYKGNVIDRCYYYIMESYKDCEWHGVHLSRQWVKDSMDNEEAIGDTRDALAWIYQTIEKVITVHQGEGPGELTKDAPLLMICRIMVSHFIGSVTVWCMLNGEFPLHDTGEYVMVELKTLLEPYIIK